MVHILRYGSKLLSGGGGGVVSSELHEEISAVYPRLTFPNWPFIPTQHRSQHPGWLFETCFLWLARDLSLAIELPSLICQIAESNYRTCFTWLAWKQRLNTGLLSLTCLRTQYIHVNTLAREQRPSSRRPLNQWRPFTGTTLWTKAQPKTDRCRHGNPSPKMGVGGLPEFRSP
jgi:hypothetical protein